MNDSFDFLGLPGLRTTAKTETDEGTVIEAETASPSFPQCCILVDQVSDGSRSARRTINDTPHGGKPLMIKMRVRRAKCRQCGKRGIDETIPHLAEGRHMTERLRCYIAREGLSPLNHRKVGRMVQVAEGTVRSVLNEHISVELAKLDRRTPRVLGLDEKMITRTYRAILGNIERRTVLDMLPDRETSLENCLDHLPDKHNVEVLCTDMFPSYHRMARRYLKGVAVVADKFHVLRRADEAMSKVRQLVIKDLDGRDRASLRRAVDTYKARQPRLTEWQYQKMADWGRRFPILSEAYHAKERFYEMYDERLTPDEAERYYRHWMKTLPHSVRAIFLKHCKIQTYFYTSVFSYFEHPFTSGYVEAVNRVLDDVHRAGRGYSFEMIRGKMMLAEKLEAKTFRPRRSSGDTWWTGGPDLEVDQNWGIDLGLLDLAARSPNEPIGLFIEPATIEAVSAIPVETCSSH